MTDTHNHTGYSPDTKAIATDFDPLKEKKLEILLNRFGSGVVPGHQAMMHFEAP